MVPALIVGVLVVAVVATFPFWLPRVVVALRIRIFARINGPDGIAIPGPLVPVERFQQVYAHPAANGRSKGAALSDLFWYWLSPGAHLHQEHLEPGERYDEVARTTRKILAVRREPLEQLTARCAQAVLDERRFDRLTFVQLRDLTMPIWAELYYEVVFEEPCPREARGLIVGNANDVVTALKCTGLRHMDRRDALTRYLRTRVHDVRHQLPDWMTDEERAFYLQGTYFNTAVVQMSEAMAHLLMVLARHPTLQARVDDDDLLDKVISETFRMYPLFGIAHRITSDEIVVDDTTTLPRGSVVCFNYPEFHRAGYDHADTFDPDRWDELVARHVNFIPFGIVANRACPARGVAPITMRVVVREVLRRYELRTSATHTRSIPNRAPVLISPRGQSISPTWLRIRLAAMRLGDRWGDVWRSLVQLVLGTYMVWDARRLRLCARYFEPSVSGAQGR
ncbi:cytochrome P450 [Tenggerimyces flavus]|uniref:Cytochrome P450 n=1 Tax=Tenggerimyces flavus TaxID=1708749 RepID=A0ABV7YDR0_9ACTN|nr:cytochrome P450 [Tenggerimyces flavus]MBM7786124.1 hypothetical protein [Tenggerimyces flavus]